MLHWVGFVVAFLGLASLNAINVAEAAPGANGVRTVKSGKRIAQKSVKSRRLGAFAKAGSARRGKSQEASLGRSISKKSGGGGSVPGLITAMAPGYGVPTWFALKIARVESNYRAGARGAAGEYGVFQMKCSTARGLGFRGGCGELFNARTNIHWGLKHLQQAVRRSGGNLRLAASKHNGGLGRKSLVPKYVRRVFG